MHLIFKTWLERKADMIIAMGISVDSIKITSGMGELPNPAIVVDHSMHSRIGQIIVWKSGFMDIEIFDINSGNRLLWQHEDLRDAPIFENILKTYFQILAESGRPATGPPRP
jgi:hypothetical protein